MALTGRLEFSPVVLVRIEIRCNHNSVVELPARERLLRLLTIQYRVEFNEHLQADEFSFSKRT